MSEGSDTTSGSGHRTSAVAGSAEAGQERASQRWAYRHRMLLDALEESGVGLGPDDHATLEWIAGWDVTVVRSVASWVLRATAAGREGAGGAQPGP